MKNLIISKTGKKGMGVFANKKFFKGEIVLKMDKSDIFSDSDLKKLSRTDFDHCYNMGNGVYFRMKPPEKFINHSCDPNVFDRQGIVFAIRNIKKGEELAYDYSISGVDKWSMKCHCRSRNCRKIIVGEFKKLPLTFQIRYLPYLEKWYKKENKELINRLITIKKKSGKNANNRKSG